MEICNSNIEPLDLKGQGYFEHFSYASHNLSDGGGFCHKFCKDSQGNNVWILCEISSLNEIFAKNHTPYIVLYHLDFFQNIL